MAKSNQAVLPSPFRKSIAKKDKKPDAVKHVGPSN